MEWDIYSGSNYSSEDEFSFNSFKVGEDADYTTQNSPSSNNIDYKPSPDLITECKPPPNLITECKPPPNLITECKPPPNLISECNPPPDLISECEPLSNLISECNSPPDPISESITSPDLISGCNPPPDLISESKKEPPPLNLNSNNQQMDHNFFSPINLFQILPFYSHQPVLSSMILSSNNEFANNYNLAKGESFLAHKRPKRKVILSANQQNFKNNFHSIFTSKKKINKQCVKKIHDYVADILGIQRMSREQFRRIDLYFRDFARYSNRIIPYLEQNKDELSKLIEEL